MTDALPKIDQWVSDKNYILLPNRQEDFIKPYIERGVPLGGFLEAIVSNDLIGAIAHADDINQYYIAEYIKWFHSFAPQNCWGNKEKYFSWLKFYAESKKKEEIPVKFTLEEITKRIEEQERIINNRSYTDDFYVTKGSYHHDNEILQRLRKIKYDLKNEEHKVY